MFLVAAETVAVVCNVWFHDALSGSIFRAKIPSQHYPRLRCFPPDREAWHVGTIGKLLAGLMKEQGRCGPDWHCAEPLQCSPELAASKTLPLWGRSWSTANPKHL